jgi:hypothetical protein
LFYFPILIILPFALKRMSRVKENRRVAFLIIYITVVNWLFIGTLSYDEPISWSGAFAWGPRYMILLLPFFVLSLGSLLIHLKRANWYVLKLSAIILLCVSGFAVNLIGKLVWVSYVANYIWEYYKLQTLFTNYWSIVTWNPFYSTILLHYRVLMDGDFVSQLRPSYYSGTVNHYVNYGLIPCSYDLYIYCNFGFLPVLGISGIVIFLGTIILQIRRENTYIIKCTQKFRNAINTKLKV